MCTALRYNKYFGRNLDLDYSYEERITIAPRNYRFTFVNGDVLENHHAIIGMAYVQNDYPLYYDAVNEYGLGMAGLNFPGNAHYFPTNPDKYNLASFEFIPYILATCKTTSEALAKCQQLNLTDHSFSEGLPNSPLHWIIADKHSAITVESTKEGLQIYENPVSVLTNNPTFDKQLFNLNNYKHLSSRDSVNNFSDSLKLESYSLGMGAIGLPGDLSSQSRFVRIVFFRENSVVPIGEELSQFFHLLQSVYQYKGATHVAHSGKYEYTIYTSCVDLDEGIYYYKTYNNSQINGVSLRGTDLDSDKLVIYPLVLDSKPHIINI